MSTPTEHEEESKSHTSNVRYLRQRSPSGFIENDLWFELPHRESLMHGTVSLGAKKEVYRAN